VRERVHEFDVLFQPSPVGVVQRPSPWPPARPTDVGPWPPAGSADAVALSPVCSPVAAGTRLPVKAAVARYDGEPFRKQTPTSAPVGLYSHSHLVTRIVIIWQGGKPLTWDVTDVSTLADSYIHSTSHSAGSAAETASIRKESKYFSLPPDYIFQQVAIETLGPLNASTVNFLSELGRRLTSLSGDSRETSFLFQRLSVLIQRFNPALIMDSFCFSDEDPDLCHQ